MKVDRAIRLFLAMVIVLLLLGLSAGLLFVSESALNIWARLQTGPAALRYAFVGALVSVVVLCVFLVIRFVVPRRPAEKPPAQKAVDEASVRARLDAADASGMQIDDAKAEFHELERRRASQSIQLCLFGEISAGKSSLIKALLPESEVAVSAVGGSTMEVRAYTWQTGSGGEVRLVDVPGSGAATENLDELAREEALRAHVVIYVCDGDLTRQQQAALKELHALDKPTIVALNKKDRYDASQLGQLRRRLEQRLAGFGRSGVRTAVVHVSAGGTESVTVIDANGHERQEVRERPADLGELRFAVREMLARDPADLVARRDQAIFRLASEKLDEAAAEYRRRRAEDIVRNYTRKAVVGALAAISPGSDIVIQGYLGTAMTRDLSALWGVSVRDMDVEEFLSLSQGRVGKAIPLTLAVAGNGLKAFPGLGTVAGGAAHAVAYGLIFDALGRSLAQTLAERGAFDPRDAAAEFEGQLSEPMEKTVRHVARLALESRRDDDSVRR
ncbi:MAG: GTPase [Pseudomonadota bacterium]